MCAEPGIKLCSTSMAGRELLRLLRSCLRIDQVNLVPVC
jgi:hypothetical protein